MTFGQNLTMSSTRPKITKFINAKIDLSQSSKTCLEV